MEKIKLFYAAFPSPADALERELSEIDLDFLLR